MVFAISRCAQHLEVIEQYVHNAIELTALDVRPELESDHAPPLHLMHLNGHHGDDIRHLQCGVVHRTRTATIPSRFRTKARPVTTRPPSLSTCHICLGCEWQMQPIVTNSE